jgi:hypothetical protein
MNAQTSSPGPYPEALRGFGLAEEVKAASGGVVRVEFLGNGDWAGKSYSSGRVEGGDATYASVEPATGQVLADIGAAES